MAAGISTIGWRISFDQSGQRSHDDVAHRNDEPIMTDAPAHDVEGVHEWLSLVDEALQGLHHALNNRIGSLSAVVELYRLGELPSYGTAFENLAADLTRLEDCNRMVRLLPRDKVAGEEPLILDDVVTDVFAIHRYLHDIRDLQVTIVPTRYVEPVRVERWALVHVLTLLLNDAKRLAKSMHSVVRAVTESDELWVRVQFRVGSPAVTEVPEPGGRYAQLLAASFGGVVKRTPGMVELRMPTLKARRAAEGS